MSIIHICHPNDRTHIELIAFRDLLRQRKDLRQEYEAAKQIAHRVDPKNPEIYNKAKEPVIQAILMVIEEMQHAQAAGGLTAGSTERE